jgi:seryl-tRNA synthetase
MLTLNLIREKPDFVIERLAVKNFDGREVVQQILTVDEKRRHAQVEREALENQVNVLSKAIADLYKNNIKLLNNQAENYKL